MALEDLLRRDDIAVDVRDAIRREIDALRGSPSAGDPDDPLARELAFRQAVDACLPSGIMTVDAEGRHAYANRAFLDMVGWSAAELDGRPAPFAYWPPEELERIGEAFRATLEERAPPGGFDLVFLRKDGTRFPVHVLSAPLRAHGRTLGWLASVVDMTARRRDEERLRASEHRYRMLFEGSRDALVIVDVATGAITEANGEALRLLRWDKGDLIGAHHTVLHPPEAADLHRRRLQERADIPLPPPIDSIVVTRDGERIPVEIHARAIELAAGRRTMLGRFVDLRERVEAERALRESEEQHRLLFQEMAQGVVYHDSSGAITAANAAAERILGVPLGELLGRAPRDPRWEAVREDGSALTPEEHPAMVALRTGREVRDVPIGVYHPGDQRHRWLLVSAVPQVRPGQDEPYQAFATFTDITDLRDARIRLEQAVVFNREIISSAGEGIIVYDHDLRYMLWNPFMERLTGMSAREVLGRRALEVHPHLREHGVGLLLERALEGATVTSDVIPYRVPTTGEQGWVVGMYSPHRSSRGEITGAIATIRDVTPAKRAEDQSRVQRDLAIALLGATTLEEAARECLDAAVALAGTDCGAVYLLRGDHPGRLAAARGLSDDQLGGFREIPPGEHLAVLAAGQPIYSQPAGLAMADEHRGRFGAAGIRAIGLVPVLQQGVPIACVCVASRETDTIAEAARPRLESIAAMMGSVVARLTAEQSLRESEQVLRESQEASRLGSYVEDIAGGTWVSSPVLDAVFGIDADYPKTVEGWAALIHPDFRGELVEYLRRVQAERTDFEMAYKIVRASDGAERWVLGRGKLEYDGAGRATRMWGTIQDITALREAEETRRRLEAQLQRTQRLESLGVLAGGIAHDFNNILAAIMGFTEITLEECDPGGRAFANLQQVHRGAERAKDLVNQILAFSRHAGMEMRPIQLDALVREALQLVRASLPASIAIEQDIDREAGCVSADGSRIHQVLVNLCANAEYAMRDGGGVLKVTLRRVEVSPEQSAGLGGIVPGDYIAVSVADTGCGMDGPTRDRIFEPFFTTKAPGEGTGLGLATSHGIVASHGGTISVYSEPGHGSVFHIYLPAVPEARGPSAAERAAHGAPRGVGRVLFVDDEAALTTMAHAMLTSLGYEVTAVTEPEEALAILQADPGGFDVLVTDQTMPGMQGLELATRGRDMCPDLGLVIMTGFVNRVDPEAADALGVREVVQKPYTRLELAGALQRALRNRP